MPGIRLRPGRRHRRTNADIALDLTSAQFAIGITSGVLLTTVLTTLAAPDTAGATFAVACLGSTCLGSLFGSAIAGALHGYRAAPFLYDAEYTGLCGVFFGAAHNLIARQTGGYYEDSSDSDDDYMYHEDFSDEEFNEAGHASAYF